MAQQPFTLVIFRNFLSGGLLQFQWQNNNFEEQIDGRKMPLVVDCYDFDSGFEFVSYL